MKQRALTLALALAAFALFYALLVPKPGAMITPASLPLSTDAGDDGELAHRVEILDVAAYVDRRLAMRQVRGYCC